MSNKKSGTRSASRGKLRVAIPFQDQPSSPKIFSTSTTRSTKVVKSPFIQDSINRIASPYRKQIEFPSMRMSPEKMHYPSLSPKKLRPNTAGRGDNFDFFPLSPSKSTSCFPSQQAMEANLVDGLTTLKIVMREYEERSKEKKILQKMVEQLRIQTAGMESRKVNFSKNYEKLHKDKLLMSDSTLNKGNQRMLIGKNIEQVRDDIMILDQDIQRSVSQNVEVAKMIKGEQIAIMNIKADIFELKQIFPVVNKEKEKLMREIQVSSKLAKNLEEKYASLMQEKQGYHAHIEHSNILKN
jgi:hypothetical protein